MQQQEQRRRERALKYQVLGAEKRNIRRFDAIAAKADDADETMLLSLTLLLGFWFRVYTSDLSLP